MGILARWVPVVTRIDLPGDDGDRQCRYLEAAVNGGGHIEVKAVRALNAAVDGGGSIVYHGDPQVTQAIDGGGSVKREGN